MHKAMTAVDLVYYEKISDNSNDATVIDQKNHLRTKLQLLLMSIRLK